MKSKNLGDLSAQHGMPHPREVTAPPNRSFLRCFVVRTGFQKNSSHANKGYTRARDVCLPANEPTYLPISVRDRLIFSPDAHIFLLSDLIESKNARHNIFLIQHETLLVAIIFNLGQS